MSFTCQVDVYWQEGILSLHDIKFFFGHLHTSDLISCLTSLTTESVAETHKITLVISRPFLAIRGPRWDPITASLSVASSKRFSSSTIFSAQSKLLSRDTGMPCFSQPSTLEPARRDFRDFKFLANLTIL
jgi:hypothetical protein